MVLWYSQSQTPYKNCNFRLEMLSCLQSCDLTRKCKICLHHDQSGGKKCIKESDNAGIELHALNMTSDQHTILTNLEKEGVVGKAVPSHEENVYRT